MQHRSRQSSPAPASDRGPRLQSLKDCVRPPTICSTSSGGDGRQASCTRSSNASESARRCCCHQRRLLPGPSCPMFPSERRNRPVAINVSMYSFQQRRTPGSLRPSRGDGPAVSEALEVAASRFVGQRERLNADRPTNRNRAGACHRHDGDHPEYRPDMIARDIHIDPDNGLRLLHGSTIVRATNSEYDDSGHDVRLLSSLISSTGAVLCQWHQQD